MSEALAQIFAAQQREINEQERRRQLARAQQEREILAFQNSGLPDIFRAIAAVLVREDVRQRIYKTKFEETTWDHCKSPRAKDMTFVSPNGSSGSGPRWWCVESPDSGRIKYIYNNGVSYKNDEVFDQPEGPWLNAFIEYAARVCDPDAIAQKMAETPTSAEQPRRRLQPV